MKLTRKERRVIEEEERKKHETLLDEEFEKTKYFRFLSCVFILKELSQKGILSFRTEFSPGKVYEETVFKIVSINLEEAWESALGDLCYNQGHYLSIHDSRQNFVIKEENIGDLYSGYYSYLREEERKENVRKTALARLTAEEKQLLGLK